MASKNTNIVSKTLVESYIRKQVKALKQSPTETIDTLTKQLLDKPKGTLEKYLLHIIHKVDIISFSMIFFQK